MQRLSVANFRAPNRGRLPVHNVTLGLLESTRDPSIKCLFATQPAVKLAQMLHFLAFRIVEIEC